MRTCIACLFLCCIATIGQTPPAPTNIGKHQIGETIQQWAAAENALLDIDTVCHGEHPDKGRCLYLQSLQNGIANSTTSAQGNRTYSWRFLDDKLSKVTIMADLSAPRKEDRILYFEEEVNFLIQVYGRPAKIEKVPYHNGYGAQWEASAAQWELPDGTLLMAIEKTEFGQQGKLLVIVFESVEQQRSDTPQPKQNPYQK